MSNNVAVPPSPSVKVLSSTSHSLKVSWLSTDHVQVEKYEVEAISTDDPPKMFVCDANNDAFQCKLAGLSPNTQYNLTVRACNRAGCGSPAVLLGTTTASSSSIHTFAVVVILFIFILVLVCCLANQDVVKALFKQIFKRNRKNIFRVSVTTTTAAASNTNSRRGPPGSQQPQETRLGGIHTSAVHTDSIDSCAPPANPSGPSGSCESPSGTTLADPSRHSNPPPYHSVVVLAEVHKDPQSSPPQYSERQMAPPCVGESDAPPSSPPAGAAGAPCNMDGEQSLELEDTMVYLHYEDSQLASCSSDRHPETQFDNPVFVE